VTRRSSWLLLGVAFAVGQAAPVSAQKRFKDAATRAAQGQEEVALPNVEAIEKGAPAPASVSFARGAPGTSATTAKSLTPEGSDDGRAGRLEGAAVDLVPPGGLFGVEGTRSADSEGDGPAAASPEFHVVKKGDTLWSLCDGYFHDPWRWPKLWSQNPRITNPHWIFPGDVVRLQASTAALAEASPAAAGDAPAAGMAAHARRGPSDSKALVLREVGYVEAKDLEVSGVISGSREEKIMLSSGDQAYLAFSRERPLKAGERYTVFVADKEHPLRNPGSNAILGYLVSIKGDVVVDQIADATTARGTLVDMIEPAERGWYVSPLVRQFRRIEPRPSAINLEAKIVASLSPANMLATETFVVLNRGKQDGVQVGNRTFVVRRADGIRRLMEGWDHFDATYPHEVVGELWVVDVRDSTALAWIARTSKELRVGETTEMRKGH
jgi:LysM domain-containing protein